MNISESRPIFDYFSDRARKAIALARKAAERLWHDHIGTEHILIGLLDEGEGQAAALVEWCGVNSALIAAAIERQLVPGTERVSTVEIPFTAGAKQALQLAFDEAKAMNAEYIGTGHLLVAVIAEGESPASAVLTEFRLKLPLLRAALRQWQMWRRFSVCRYFSRHAKEAMLLARMAADKLRHDYIGAEHLLLGLLEVMQSEAWDFEFCCTMDPAAIAAKLQKQIRAGTQEPSSSALPLTPAAKRVLELAVREAVDTKASKVGVGHLFVGLLLVEEEGLAPAHALSGAGLTLAALKAGIAPPDKIETDQAGLRDAFETMQAEMLTPFEIPTVDLTTFSINPEAVKRVDKSFALSRRVVPIDFYDKVLTVAISSPADVTALDDLSFVLNCEVLPMLAPEEQINWALRKLYGADTV